MAIYSQLSIAKNVKMAIKFENPFFYTTFMGVSHGLQYLNELQVLKVEDGKKTLKD